MPCPVCKLALIDDEPGQRSCTKCKGTMLTSGKLDELLKSAAPHSELSTASIAISELPPHLAAKHHRECPDCATTMASGTVFAVLVDRCEAHGVWVDAGELSRIVLAARRHDRAR